MSFYDDVKSPYNLEKNVPIVMLNLIQHFPPLLTVVSFHQAKRFRLKGQDYKQAVFRLYYC